MVEPSTRNELLKRFDSGEWFDALREHLSLISLLESCIIQRKYRIPDDLNTAIVLTDAGKRLLKNLVTQENVPPKEARLLVYLQALYVEPLVDFEATRLDTIRESISTQIIKSDLLYPYMFGRTLYQRAADMFRDEKERLKHEETLDLLAGQEPGVFHIGHNLIGPYGLIVTGFERSIRPRTRIPLQHCSDSACMRVHTVQLITSHEADVNRYRSAMHRILEEEATEPSDWNGFLEKRMEEQRNEFADNGVPGVSMLLGEVLDDTEIRLFFEYVLDHSGGALRSVALKNGLPDARADDVTKGVSRQQLHQLLLTISDEDLVGYLDAAVLAGIIVVPTGEVRTLRVNASSAVSAWRLRPQLSQFGYRAIGNDSEVPVLRLGVLIRKLYDLDVDTELDELEWHLREVSGMPLHSRLEHILRTLTPRELIARLVFARRANLTKACAELGVDDKVSESEIVDRIVWKLGFRMQGTVEVVDEYWRAHREFERTSRSGLGIGEYSTSQLRGRAADYGVALEAYLEQALIFCWWSLLFDHYGSGRSFTYRPDSARDFARSRIRESAERLGVDDLRGPGKLTLAPLMMGFRLLCRELESARDDGAQYLRPQAEWPRFTSSTDMQLFPFSYSLPFLNLDESAQDSILSMLSEATFALQGSDIAEVRNSFLHAGREPKSPKDIIHALSLVQASLSSLESSGLCPKPFRYVRSSEDRWGRKEYILSTDDEGDTQVVHSPSRFDWVGLPPKRADQAILRIATIGHGAECLRFRWGADSRYQRYWEGYPSRRVRAEGFVEQNSDAHSGSVLGGRSELTT